MTVAETPVRDAARAVEMLRLSEARLTRRRQTGCGPSENARAAMRSYSTTCARVHSPPSHGKG